MKTKIMFIITFLLSGIFLSMNGVLQNDPLDILLQRTTNPKLKEQTLVFKKGGYQKKVNYKNYDIEAIIGTAKSYLGTPHRMGGLSTHGIDCSGLVMIAHQQNGILLPHDSNEQARFGKIILSVNELKRGDLVFFHSTYKTSKLVTHSGIYLGDDKFIHVSSKMGAGIAHISSKYWSEHFLFGTKL